MKYISFLFLISSSLLAVDGDAYKDAQYLAEDMKSSKHQLCVDIIERILKTNFKHDKTPGSFHGAY
jgi:hypothetical protein